MAKTTKSEPATKRGPGRPPKPTLPPPTLDELKQYDLQAAAWQKDQRGQRALRAWIERSLLVQAQRLHEVALRDPGQVGILAHRAFVECSANILQQQAPEEQAATTGSAALLSRVQ